MSCPICGRPTERRVRPFCSKRCADIDLGKWMRGDYAVPSRDPDDIEAAAEAVTEAEIEAADRQGKKPH